MSNLTLEYDLKRVRDNTLELYIINISFNKTNINNVKVVDEYETFHMKPELSKLIMSKINIINKCYETFINSEEATIINQTRYIIFYHYNMPVLKIVNTSDMVDAMDANRFYATFHV